MCEKKQIGFIETSAFEATNVESAFDKIVSCIQNNILIEIYAANAKKLDEKAKKIDSEKIELGQTEAKDIKKDSGCCWFNIINKIKYLVRGPFKLKY